MKLCFDKKKHDSSAPCCLKFPDEATPDKNTHSTPKLYPIGVVLYLFMILYKQVVSPLQPERINPEGNDKGYDIRSDVWSLGISLVSFHS